MKNHIDEQEGMEDFNAHPGEWGKQGVMHRCRHPLAHTLPPNIGKNPSKEEEQVEEGERDH